MQCAESALHLLFLVANDLYIILSLTRAIKLKEINTLRVTKQQLSFVDRQGHVDTNQRRLNMACGVLGSIMLVFEINSGGN